MIPKTSLGHFPGNKLLKMKQPNYQTHSFSKWWFPPSPICQLTQGVLDDGGTKNSREEQHPAFTGLCALVTFPCHLVDCPQTTDGMECHSSIYSETMLCQFQGQNLLPLLSSAPAFCLLPGHLLCLLLLSVTGFDGLSLCFSLFLCLQKGRES